MYSGYLQKRDQPVSPPPMVRFFCVLYGTMLLDYDTEESSLCSMNPRCVVEIIGVSDWDGKGRATRYDNAFLIVTHTGKTHYCCANSVEDKKDWILHIKQSLECAVLTMKSPKQLFENITQDNDSISSSSSSSSYYKTVKCAKSNKEISLSSSVKCNSCLRHFSSEFVTSQCTLLQRGEENAHKVCSDCNRAQMILIWLKNMNHVHALSIHDAVIENNHCVSSEYKATMQLHRRVSERLDQAAELRDQGHLSEPEFAELRHIDLKYRREMIFDLADRLDESLDKLGPDIQTVIDLLNNPATTDSGGLITFRRVIHHILSLAEEQPRVMEFYLPQIMQAHLLLAKERNDFAMRKVDLLQRALIAMAVRVPQIASKVCWTLIATIGDYLDVNKALNTVSGHVTEVQYAACQALLMQIELSIEGSLSVVNAEQMAVSGIAPGNADRNHTTTSTSSSSSFALPSSSIVNRKLDVIDLMTRTTHISHALTSAIQFQASVQQQAELAIEMANLYRSRHVLSRIYVRDLEQRNAALQSTATPPPPFPSVSTQPPVPGHSDSNSTVRPKAGEAGTVEEVASSFTRRRGSKGRELELVQEREEAAGKSEIVTAIEILDEDDYDPIMVDEGYDDYVDKFRELVSGADLGSCLDIFLRIGESEVRLNGDKGDVLNDENGVNPSLADRSGNDDTESEAKALDTSRRLVICRKYDRTCLYEQKELQLKLEMQQRNIETDSDTETKEYSVTDSVTSDADTSDNIDELEEDINPSRYSLRFQLDFINKLTDLVEELRFVDRPKRTELLKTQLNIRFNCNNLPTKSTSVGSSIGERSKIFGSKESLDGIVSGKGTEDTRSNNDHSSPVLGNRILDGIGNGRQELGLDPTRVAGEPRYRMTRIIPTDCRVFRTKARAPSLITCEVLRLDDDAYSLWGHESYDTLTGAHTVDTRDRSISESTGIHSVASLSKAVSEERKNAVKTIVSESMTKAIADLHTKERAQSTEEWKFDKNDEIANENKNDKEKVAYAPRRNSNKLLSDSRKTVSKLSTMSMATDTNGSSSTETSTNNSPYRSTSGLFPTTGRGEKDHDPFASAKRLLDKGAISQQEYVQLISAEMRYRDEEERHASAVSDARVEKAFGERWAHRRRRVLGDEAAESAERAESLFAATEVTGDFDASDWSLLWPSRDVRCFIVKSNDDLRQEVCCLQLMELCWEILQHNGLGKELYLRPYRIVATGNSTGIIEVVPDTLSLDALKKTAGFTSLPSYFERSYGTSPERLKSAKMNFCASLAAYSLFTYILQIKDRHNGNILLSADGHIIHIDFGFLLTIAPGGAFSLESSPFKLTEEFVEVLDGLESDLFNSFVKAFTHGFIELQANVENIVSVLRSLSENSPYPCFAFKDPGAVIEKLKQRLRPDLDIGATVHHCLDLIISSYGHLGTRQYDSFQYYSNGIAV